MAKSKTILEITKKGEQDPIFKAIIPDGTDAEDVLDGIARTLASIAVCSGVGPEDLVASVEDYIAETGLRLIDAARENNDSEAMKYFKTIFDYYVDPDDEDFDDEEVDDEDDDIAEEELKTCALFSYKLLSFEIEETAREMHCSIEDVMADLKKVLEKDEDNRDNLIETIINERFPAEESE